MKFDLWWWLVLWILMIMIIIISIKSECNVVRVTEYDRVCHIDLQNVVVIHCYEGDVKHPSVHCTECVLEDTK